MKSLKEKSNKKIFIGICISLLAIVLCTFVYTGRQYGNQAMNALYLSAEFHGEYKVADGSWQPYVKGEHIPANKGDVTLKGHFQLFVPTTGEIVGNAQEGTVLAFYFNHIGGEVSEGGEEFRPFDAESNLIGEDLCGEMYIGYECKGAEEITIRLKNPHKFGNPGAVDDFLSNVSTYGGTDFERDTLNRGSAHRVLGIALILFAFMILGTAIFSMLIHIKGSKNLWLVGFGVFSAGIYFLFKAHGVMFFSEIIKFNTRTDNLNGVIGEEYKNLNPRITFTDGKAKTSLDTFSDLVEDSEYAEAAEFVIENGLMSGVSESRFAPYVTSTRAMIVTTLWRMKGCPAADNALNFEDVALDSWYTVAVRWAASTGIVNGYSNDLFAPHDKITREQLASIMWRYAKNENADVSIGENTNILSYEDVFSVSDYAIPAFQWTCGSEIMSGNTISTLAPNEQVSRIYFASVLHKYAQYVAQK